MRTVISHFFNEEYLLPWWLEHHVKLFERGLLIDHGSTDNSVDICRQIAPHWRILKSRLTQFDAWLTDFEVMTHELEIKGWKITLNTSEFLVANPGLDEIERFLKSEKRVGVAASGMTMVDKLTQSEPIPDFSLIQQKPWAIDTNIQRNRWIKRLLGYPESLPIRNRFYHELPTGMYHPGRHGSFHPDWNFRMPNLMVLHFAYSPWTEKFIKRKIQIGHKISDGDKERGWGLHHQRTHVELNNDFGKINRMPFFNINDVSIDTKFIGK